MLVSQASSAAQNALIEGTVSPEKWQQLESLIAVVENKSEISRAFLEKAAKAMELAVDLLEEN
ncbi:MAG: hypothetical protein COB54_08600 [Alphaproteobacteria bacterium]|nr:MAG: hypothetical protein COB54_08600 [Alphaproteobacteria bacterium]